MKTYKYLLAALIVVACFACNKKLDVQPQNNVTDIQTGDDVEALLFGGYSLLQNASAFGEQYIFIADLLADADQLDFVGTFTDYKDLWNKNYVIKKITADDGTVRIHVDEQGNKNFDIFKKDTSSERWILITSPS